MRTNETMYYQSSHLMKTYQLYIEMFETNCSLISCVIISFRGAICGN